MDRFDDPQPTAEILSIGEPFERSDEYQVFVDCVIYDLPVFYVKSLEMGYETIKFYKDCSILRDQVKVLHGKDLLLGDNKIPYTRDKAENLSFFVSSSFKDTVKGSLESLLPYPGLDVSNIDIEVSPRNYGAEVKIAADIALTEDPSFSRRTDVGITFPSRDIQRVGFIDKAIDRCCDEFASLLEGQIGYFQRLREKLELYYNDLSEVVDGKTQLEEMVDTARAEYPDVSFYINYIPSQYLDQNGEPYEEKDKGLSLYLYTPLAYRSPKYTSVELVIGLGDYENVYNLSLVKLPSEMSFIRTIRKKVNELKKAAR